MLVVHQCISEQQTSCFAYEYIQQYKNEAGSRLYYSHHHQTKNVQIHDFFVLKLIFFHQFFSTNTLTTYFLFLIDYKSTPSMYSVYHSNIINIFTFRHNKHP